MEGDDMENIDPEVILDVWLDALVESAQNGETDLTEHYLCIKRVVAWREQNAIEHWVKAQMTSPLGVMPPAKDLQRIFATGPGQYMTLQEVNTEIIPTPTVRVIKSTKDVKPGEVWVKVSGNGLFALSLDN